MNRRYNEEKRNLEQQISSAQYRLEQLQQRNREAPTTSSELQTEAITELSIALEELSVTTEELHEQNEELLATRTELEEERQRYQDLFNFAPGGYLVTDGKGIIQEVNNTAATLLNVPKKYLVGKPLDIFVARADKNFFTRQWQKASQIKEKLVMDWEIRLQPREGESFPAAIFVTSICDAQGNAVMQRWLFQDLSEKKQLEAQLLHAQRLENLSNLSAGIAHELNNILTPVLSGSQLLQHKLSDLDQSSKQLLQLIETYARRGGNIVKQLLLFARDIEGQRVILPVQFLIEEIQQMMTQVFPKSIDLETNVGENMWHIRADISQLHQMLMNLCINARDAMPDGGLVKISAKNIFCDQNYVRQHPEAKVQPYVMITVADTGMGIAPETLQSIFEPFFTTKEVGKGTGLGLAIVASIVKNHNGFIEVTSEVGLGTKFKIFLPALETSQAQVIPLVNSPKLQKGNGELLLVVDDESGICSINQELLETYGYQVITTNNSVEAVSLYAQRYQEISVVLMDLMMPYMDGLTASYQLQETNPQVQIIAVTGLNRNTQIATELTNAGVKAFLSKPYSLEELLRTLHEVITLL